MARLTGAWSPAETVAFPEDATVPVRVACRTPSGHLRMPSPWYRHEGTDPNEADPDGDAPAVGTINCATGTDADVIRYLRADSEVAFEISTNRPPYRGVGGRGTAALEPDEDEALLRTLPERYSAKPTRRSRSGCSRPDARSSGSGSTPSGCTPGTTPDG